MIMNLSPAGYGRTGSEPDRYVSQPVRPAGNGPRHAAWDVGRPAVAIQPSPSLPRPARRPGPSDRVDRWPLIADDLFKAVHDDWGKPLLHRRVAGLALAAALLAELLHTGFVTIDDGVVHPMAAAKPVDPVGTLVMAQVRAEPDELAVRDWLDFLASTKFPGGDAYAHVTRRLEQTRHVRVEKRGLIRRSTRCVPLDGSDFAWPLARLAGSLRRHERLPAFDVFLGGLILATDLCRRVLTIDVAETEPLLRHAISEAPLPVRGLLDHLESAVGTSVVSGA
jgi:hypothetical protein